MRIYRSILVLPLAFLLLMGCESELSQPAEMTLQAKTAFEVLPADVRIVGALDVETAYQEHLADEWLNQAQLDGELQARFDEFIELTGFDPREDVREVYVSMSGPDDAHPEANLVVYANFDQGRLTAYLNEKLDNELLTDTYKSTTIYHPAEEGGRDEMFFAPVNDEMLVAATSFDGIVEMLDRLDGQGMALDQNADVMRLIGKVARTDGAWVVMQHPFTGKHQQNDGDHQMDQISRMVEDVVVSTGFERNGLDIDVQLTTRDGVDAEDMADAMRGMVAGMKMSSKQNEAMLRTLDGISIKTRGDGVRVQAFVDEGVLTEMKHH